MISFILAPVAKQTIMSARKTRERQFLPTNAKKTIELKGSLSTYLTDAIQNSYYSGAVIWRRSMNMSAVIKRILGTFVRKILQKIFGHICVDKEYR